MSEVRGDPTLMCSSLCLKASLSPGPARSTSCFTVRRVLRTPYSRGRCSSQCCSADFTQHKPDLEPGVEVVDQVAALLGAAPGKLHQGGVHLYSVLWADTWTVYSSEVTIQQHSTNPARTRLLTAAGGFLQQRVELCSGGLLADQAGQVGESGAELPRVKVGSHPAFLLQREVLWYVQLCKTIFTRFITEVSQKLQ